MSDYPPHWRKGELLNVKRYVDGSYRITALSDEANKPATLEFASTDACQAFVSAWYAPEAGR